MNFTLTTHGKLPDWVTEPIELTLIEGGEETDNIIVKIGEIATYTGTGIIVITSK